MVCLPPRVVIAIQCPSFFRCWIVLLGRVPSCRVFTVADNWANCNSRCLIDNACASTFCPILAKSLLNYLVCLSVASNLLVIFLQHILNSSHTTSTIRRSNFMILRWNIMPTPIISVTIVTQVEVVVAVVTPISDIMTLLVVITIVPTLISLTMAPILLIGSLGV